MDQHDEGQGVDYPRGRGYGNDYLRGGEVLGGYGYEQRDEYHRPRGELRSRRQSQFDDGSESVGAEGASKEVERFPQDERAGGWEIPHDLNEG